MRILAVTALAASLVALSGRATPAAAAGTEGAAPADLRELAGQAVPGEQHLQWKYAEVMIEWGFAKGTQRLAFDGSLQCTQTGMVGRVAPLPGDGQTVVTAQGTWKSPATGQGRRGIVVPVLYTPAVRGPGRTILTVRTCSGSFSFQPIDLEDGPILLREYGFFVRATTRPRPPQAPQPAAAPRQDARTLVLAGLRKTAPPAPGQAAGWQPPVVTMESRATTAAEYLAELASRQPKTLRQQVRARPEQTWEAAMRAVHGPQALPPFPKPPYEPKMVVEVPDPNLAALWRIGAWQIIKRCPRVHREDVVKVGRSGDVGNDCRRIDDPADPNGVYVVRDNPFPPLGCETDRILWALDHLGMHQVARDGMSIWLANPQPDGALSLGSGMEHAHKFGALLLPWVMAEHYRLTGDKEWLRKELPRLKAAVDWIIKRRRGTMKPVLSPEEQAGIKRGTWSPYGLQPRIQMGDGDPAGANYYYMADAAAHRSVKLLAEVAGAVDAKLAAELAAEAENYRKDILCVVEESLVRSPVLRTRDGTSRFFLPQGFQYSGPCARALPPSADIFSHCGPYSSDIVATSAAIEAWLASGLLSIDDPRIDGHFEVLEDLFLRDHPWMRKRKADYDPERDWFSNGGWGYQSGWERVPDFYLAKDDVPNFLRAWLNRCAIDMNLSNWTFNEHTTFAANDKSHGNAVFLSNFRRMLVMEIGDALWLSRATPRAWLEQGKRIAVRNAPTYFGSVAYEITSDVAHGKITASVEIPGRKPPGRVVLRFRHPRAAPIKSVTVNGKDWEHFDKDQEAVELQGLAGTATVTARY
jgi:hypothetical protein